MKIFECDLTFKDIKPFPEKVWLSSLTMHGPELTYMNKAFDTIWVNRAKCWNTTKSSSILFRNDFRRFH